MPQWYASRVALQNAAVLTTDVPAGGVITTLTARSPSLGMTQAGPALVNSTFIGTVSPTLPFNAAPVTWKSAVLTEVTGTVTTRADPSPPAWLSTSFTAGAVPATGGVPFSSAIGSPCPTFRRSSSLSARSSTLTRRGFSSV